MWTRAAADRFIQTIVPAFRHAGWIATLGGGLLTRRLSRKDLDIFLVPMLWGRRRAPAALLKYLEEQGWALDPVCRRNIPFIDAYFLRKTVNRRRRGLDLFFVRVDRSRERAPVNRIKMAFLWLNKAGVC